MNSSSGNNNFASVEISDAVTKFRFYMSRLMSIQQGKQSSSLESHQRCSKIIHLSFENFIKYNQNPQYSKQVYEQIKLQVITKRSYYSLYLFDLFIKNNRWFIKTAKKDIQMMFKLVWQKVWAQYQNQQKIENLKIIINCWAYLYGDKIFQNIRKWLQTTYNMRKIQLNPENQKLLKQVYGEKLNYNKSEKQKLIKKDQRLNQLLLNSINDSQKKEPNNNSLLKKTFSNQESSKKTNLNGVTKGLLQALELD